MWVSQIWASAKAGARTTGTSAEAALIPTIMCPARGAAYRPSAPYSTGKVPTVKGINTLLRRSCRRHARW
ncbi:hypothetical protein TUM20984_42140 [Mycobacterium antarcticum]|nr:hypothetical protein TUM20984_42140 [Mycolicibacterium sp. TUM20984]